MGESFITRRSDGSNISVKKYNPFKASWGNTTTGTISYEYQDCDFEGRTFLLYSATKNRFLFGIIKNGVLVESSNGYSTDNYDVQVQISNDTMKVFSYANNIDVLSLIEI